MKASLTVLALTAGAEAFAPTQLATSQISQSQQLTLKPRYSYHLNIDGLRLYASAASDSCSQHEDSTNVSHDERFRTKLLQRKSKPVAFAIATASTLLSCLPGQSLFKPLPAQASAPIVLREALPKDDPPMVQAMTKAKELKKKRSLEEFDAFMQKLNDIEDAEGKKARDAYEKQYQAEKEAKTVQKAIDLEKLKRDLLDEGKDPNTFLDAEQEVFLFEHDVDLAKVPGTPHNEQMIKNFRARGKNLPTYENQIYIVKCQVADLKARGVDPLEHFSKQEVMDKTRAIYKMDKKVAAKVAEEYKGLMDQYGGRLSPAQEGEAPFVRSTKKPLNELSAKEKRAAEKAAAKAKRAAEKKTRVEARAKAKADKASSKQKGRTKIQPVEEIKSVEIPANEIVAQNIPKEDTTSATKSKKKKSSAFDIATITKKVSPKQAAIVVVGGGAAALGYRLYDDISVSKRNEQYRSIMSGMDEVDDDDFDDDDDYDDDY